MWYQNKIASAARVGWRRAVTWCGLLGFWLQGCSVGLKGKSEEHQEDAALATVVGSALPTLLAQLTVNVLS